MSKYSCRKLSYGREFFRRIRLKKKAQLEMQINWIYVLIVGVVILAFFFLLANSQKKSAEKSMAYTVSKNMEYLLTITKSNTDSSTPINLYGTEMDYTCSEGFAKISVDSATSDLPGMIVFAPGLLRGDNVLAWTQSWFAPYKIDNFVYISSPKTLYYIVYNGTINAKLGDKINKSIPAIFNVVLDNKLNWSRVSNDNYDNIKVVFLGVSYDALVNLNKNPIIFSNVGNAKISVMSIEPYTFTYDDTVNIGKVYFYNVESNGQLDVSNQGETRYYGFGSLLAAIFSDDKNSYECALMRGFLKMQVQNSILLNRTDYLLSKVGDPLLTPPPVTPLRCLSSLMQVQLSLEDIDSILKTKSNVISIVEALKSEWTKLDSDNDLLEAASCPLTY